MAKKESKPTAAITKKKKSLRIPKSNNDNSLLDAIIHGMQEKKAHNIVCLDMRHLGGNFADYFVICHGNSRTQTSAIAQSIEEQVSKLMKIDANHVEGAQNGEWILLDYFDIIAHVFLDEKRDFYGLENLWGDAEIKRIAQ